MPCRGSSVVEHSTHKAAVVGSIPTLDTNITPSSKQSRLPSFAGGAWLSVDLARQPSRLQPRLAVLQVQNIAAPFKSLGKQSLLLATLAMQKSPFGDFFCARDGT